MNILLIYPNRDRLYFKGQNEKLNVFHYLLSKIVPFQEKLTLPILAATTPKKHKVKMMEGAVKDFNFNEKYDLVGIHCITSTACIAYKIADEFRLKGAKVVLGGWHPSALPKEAKQHADSVVIGEADETWPQLLKDLENKKMKPFYYPTRPVDPKIIPYPRLELCNKSKVISVQATRGCPTGCEFCSITNMKYRNIFRMRPIENVINEIKSHPGRHFVFHDNSLTINPNYTIELFNEIIKEDIKKTFSAMGNINILAKNDDLLKFASEAGCKSWFIGFESICQESLNGIGKKSNIVTEYLTGIKKIHDYGMKIHGSFVFGFDQDKIDIFDETDDFVRKSEIDIPEPLVLTPFPGTSLFKRLEKEGRILTKDWSKYDIKHVVFQPKNMTPLELFENTRGLYEKWYKNTNIFRRVIKVNRDGFWPLIIKVTKNYYMKSYM